MHERTINLRDWDQAVSCNKLHRRRLCQLHSPICLDDNMSCDGGARAIRFMESPECLESKSREQPTEEGVIDGETIGTFILKEGV